MLSARPAELWDLEFDSTAFHSPLGFRGMQSAFTQQQRVIWVPPGCHWHWNGRLYVHRRLLLMQHFLFCFFIHSESCRARHITLDTAELYPWPKECLQPLFLFPKLWFSYYLFISPCPPYPGLTMQVNEHTVLYSSEFLKTQDQWVDQISFILIPCHMEIQYITLKGNSSDLKKLYKGFCGSGGSCRKSV